MSLAGTLEKRNSTGRRAFVPFIMAGDPSLKATEAFVRALARAGADLIELGVPFSDPVADGPVIQDASLRSLKAGTTLKGVLSSISRLRRRGERVPLILFTYLNPVLSLGAARFAALAAKSGVDGVLIVDLPVEEAGPISRALKVRGVEPVLLASPSTTPERLKAVGKASGGVVYYVLRKGVTGARKDLAEGMAARLRKVRALTGKALIAGFGVSSPAQARRLARSADGVVVGSALVAAAAGLPVKKAILELTHFTRRMTAGLEGTC